MDMNNNECKLCFDVIDDDTQVHFRFESEAEWIKLYYCKDCVLMMINNKWSMYISNLRKAECKNALTNIIKKGPPRNFSDNSIMEGKEIYEFFYNNEIHSAKLTGSLDDDNMILFHSMLLDILPLLKPQLDEFDDTKINIKDIDYNSRIQHVLSFFNL